MRTLPTHPLRLAVVATAVLGGVLLGHAVDSTTAAYAVVNAVAGTTAAAAAVGMATRGTFASRLVAAVVTSASGVVALVLMALGTPGGAPAEVTFAGSTLVACGVLVPVLLAVHRGPGGPGRRVPDRPYAR